MITRRQLLVMLGAVPLAAVAAQWHTQPADAKKPLPKTTTTTTTRPPPPSPQVTYSAGGIPAKVPIKVPA